MDEFRSFSRELRNLPLKRKRVYLTVNQTAAIILGVLFAILVAYNVHVTKRINQSFYMKESRRKLHKRFIWYLPFLGAFLIKGYWKKDKDEPFTMTKKDRKHDKSNFYESGIAMHGGGEVGAP